MRPGPIPPNYNGPRGNWRQAAEKLLLTSHAFNHDPLISFRRAINCINRFLLTHFEINVVCRPLQLFEILTELGVLE